MHVKKGDTVQILVGNDRGKNAKVIRAFPKTSQVLVEGINKVKRHRKGSDAGIIEKEMPLHASNVKKVS